jgi:hypothetical protein
VYCRLLAMRIPTPLLLFLELCNMSYLGEKKLLKPFCSVFNLRSERNIIVVCKARIAAIFLLCLGQFVETFNELQLRELKDR